jgi:putative membrane protein
MITTPRFTLVLVALSLGGAAGCSADGADDGGANGAETQPAIEAAPVTPEAAAPAPTDPQIAHIAVTANAIDVEIARLAQDRTTTPEILAFARTMITDHTAVNERAAALSERLGVTPEDNPVSQSLQDGAAEATVQLSGLEGEAFDRAYVEREVAYHQAVLDALDQTLIPSATNAELRGLLEEVRPAIAAHLDHARALQTGAQTGQ